MKQSRFWDSQIVSMYGGMIASELKRLKETAVELAQNKKMYAGLVYENYALEGLIEKKL